MRFIQGFINQEINHFKNLHPEAQRLLFASMLFNFLSPVFSIFINAFLWRQSHDILLVAFFNLIFFTCIPFSFYTNRFLLKYFPPNAVCYTALTLEGFVVTSLIFLTHISYPVLLFFGILYGVTAGFYWSNRNFLKMKTTQSDNRIYYTSLEASSSTITNVFVPLFIGWFITFGSIIHLYSPLIAYRIVALMMLSIIAAIAFVMHGHAIKYRLGNILTQNASKSWHRVRMVQFFGGLNDGLLIFLPTLMVLILVGNEGTLGAIQSLSAIIASLIIYILAKYLHIKHRTMLFGICFLFLILGGGIFALLFSALGVALYFAFFALGKPFHWVAISSLSLDVMDRDKEENRYAYVCDQEIYLNGGRVLGILLFIGAVHIFSSELALRYAPVLIAISQLLVVFAAKSAEKHHK